MCLMTLDLGILNRGSQRLSFSKALRWTLFWVCVTLTFNLFLYLKFGVDPALDFLTGYIIEYSLSVDNLFVFLIIFAHFSVPETLQRRVLFFGILGAIIMR